MSDPSSIFFFPFSKRHKGLLLLPDLLTERAKEIVVRWTLAMLPALLAPMMFGTVAGMASTRLLDGTATVISNDLATWVAKGG
jgi:hypothetical protein